jgi:hypothetical protein
MAAQLQISANLLVKGDFKIGPNPQPPNQFELSITNSGESIQITPKKCLYLEGLLGSGEKALFLDEADAQLCNKSSPKDWKVVWDFSGREKGEFRLKIYSFKKLETDQTLTISFSNVISKTAPNGAAALSFATAFSDAKQALTIPKTADKPDIISFYAAPPEGVQNLPGDDVTLKWRTYKLANLELIQIGMADPLSCDFSQDEGSKIIQRVSANMTFRLKGYDGPKPISRDLGVQVLQKGWYGLTNTVLEGDPGYPLPETENEIQDLDRSGKDFDLEPTLLFTAADLLYAVFRLRFAQKQNALLFQTQNPFGGWTFVKSSVPDQAGFIPAGFDTSPGVFFDNRLGLVGGSQIDPDNTSNGVWCFDPQKGVWENWGEAQWSPRMGHAVQVFVADQKEKIWVMGGRDESGNALNDIWTLDVTSRSWTPRQPAPWKPRCLFNTAVFEDKIWLYGGAEEPFSTQLYDDLYVYEKGGKWEKKDMTGIIKGNVFFFPFSTFFIDIKVVV